MRGVSSPVFSGAVMVPGQRWRAVDALVGLVVQRRQPLHLVKDVVPAPTDVLDWQMVRFQHDALTGSSAAHSSVEPAQLTQQPDQRAVASLAVKAREGDGREALALCLVRELELDELARQCKCPCPAQRTGWCSACSSTRKSGIVRWRGVLSRTA